MKKNVTKLSASLLAVVFAFSTSAFASNPEQDLTAAGGSGIAITATSTVKNPVYQVTVPTTTDFTIDAYDVDSDGQVHSGDLHIQNKSDIAVRLNIQAKVVAATGVTLKTKASDVNAVSSTNTDKDIYVNLTPAKESGVKAATPAFNYVDAEAETLGADYVTVSFDMGTPSGITPADAENNVERTVTTPTHVGFKIGGAANPIASWSATTGSEDVKLDLKYSFNGLTNDMEGILLKSDDATNGTRKIYTTVSDKESASANADDGIKVKLFDGTDDISKLKSAVTAGKVTVKYRKSDTYSYTSVTKAASATLGDDEYSIDDDGVITIKPATALASGKSYVYGIIYDNKAYTATVAVPEAAEEEEAIEVTSAVYKSAGYIQIVIPNVSSVDKTKASNAKIDGTAVASPDYDVNTNGDKLRISVASDPTGKVLTFTYDGNDYTGTVTA